MRDRVVLPVDLDRPGLVVPEPPTGPPEHVHHPGALPSLRPRPFRFRAGGPVYKQSRSLTSRLRPARGQSDRTSDETLYSVYCYLRNKKRNIDIAYIRTV